VRLSGALRYYKRELATMSGKKKTDGASGVSSTQPVSAPLARAVSLHLEGKRKEALRELNTAIESGEESADIYAAKGHIQFELEQYDDAVKTYEKLLGAAPQHPTANFNLGFFPESSDGGPAAGGSQSGMGHLPVAPGEAGAGHHLLRQGTGIEPGA